MPHDTATETHWHEPSANKKAGYGKFARPMSAYDLFMESEGIPVFDVQPAAIIKRNSARILIGQHEPPKNSRRLHDATRHQCRLRRF